jgi:hypothetical protein
LAKPLSRWRRRLRVLCSRSRNSGAADSLKPRFAPPQS